MSCLLHDLPRHHSSSKLNEVFSYARTGLTCTVPVCVLHVWKSIATQCPDLILHLWKTAKNKLVLTGVEMRTRLPWISFMCVCVSLCFCVCVGGGSLSCLMRTRDERCWLTHAPCCRSSPSSFISHSFSYNMNGCFILGCLQFFFSLLFFCILFWNPHTPLRHISTHANGTLSQSSLWSNVCNDCSHQSLYWICFWVCVSFTSSAGCVRVCV